ncbi:MAG: L-aspartate oxidase [Acidobacteriota bacterium]|nr:L-aspartate oxidase [Acidobacteriota bacterium]
MHRDFVIVGSGIAGLRAALALADAGRVLVLTKAEPLDSNTGYAQGGIAVALGADDSPDLHAADTLAAGDGLCDEAAVRVLVEEGPRYARELVAWGTRFDTDAEGRLAFGREAAHSVRRVLHARDATGREIARALWARVSAIPSIEVQAAHRVVDLIVRDGRCAGVRVLGDDGTVETIEARATLLATGGAGQVFQETTNPAIATGDGVALAYRAGVRVADLEFVQFHPTALKLAGAPRFLLSEALRGEGARLINQRDEPFMTRYDAAGDLAPRDVVARGIEREAAATGGPIFLTLAHLDAAFVRARFPTIAEACAQAGLDLARDRIPVGPAAHYVMGGIETDVWGRTSLPGLFAAGEVACTGVHGANRLASNSLLEGLVFGARAGDAMHGPERPAVLRSSETVAIDEPPGATGPVALEAEDVRALMWRSVGLFRDRPGLDEAIVALDRAFGAFRATLAAGEVRTAADWRFGSLVTVGRLVAHAARRREESRGGHFRTDFPVRDDVHWKVHVAERLQPQPDTAAPLQRR